jgi:hypothetical protein
MLSLNACNVSCLVKTDPKKRVIELPEKGELLSAPESLSTAMHKLSVEPAALVQAKTAEVCDNYSPHLGICAPLATRRHAALNAKSAPDRLDRLRKARDHR